MSALRPDYDDDPGRRLSWVAPLDVHDVVGPELTGRVLDVGCGEGRLVAALAAGTDWCGIDSSPHQLGECRGRPVVLGDMLTLPFPDGVFDAVVQLWCLYHVDSPQVAVAEAWRVLRSGGRYYACTSARDNDPELVPEGYPATTFDAEEAAAIVSTIFEHVEATAWDQPFFPLETRDEIRRYCRHNLIPSERAETAHLPLWLTKRGVVVRAMKP